MIDVASGEAFKIFCCNVNDLRMKFRHMASAMADGNVYLLSFATSGSSGYHARKLNGWCVDGV